MDEPIRILVADDHAGFRSGLDALLATQPDLRIVGNAETGDEAWPGPWRSSPTSC
jgi:two-component system NarL family response regulator